MRELIEWSVWSFSISWIFGTIYYLSDYNYKRNFWAIIYNEESGED